MTRQLLPPFEYVQHANPQRPVQDASVAPHASHSFGDLSSIEPNTMASTAPNSTTTPQLLKDLTAQDPPNPHQTTTTTALELADEPGYNFHLNFRFSTRVRNITQLTLEDFADVSAYGYMLECQYSSMYFGNKFSDMLEALVVQLFLQGLTPCFDEWKEEYMRTHRLFPEGEEDMEVEGLGEVINAAIGEEERMRRVAEDVEREADRRVAEEERRTAKVKEESMARTVRTFEEVPASSVVESERESAVDGGDEDEEEEGDEEELEMELERMKRMSEARRPWVAAWLEGAEMEDVIADDVMKEGEEEDEQEEVDFVPSEEFNDRGQRQRHQRHQQQQQQQHKLPSAQPSHPPTSSYKRSRLLDSFSTNYSKTDPFDIPETDPEDYEIEEERPRWTKRVKREVSIEL